MASPTPPPTTHIYPWQIHSTTAECISDNCFKNNFLVTNSVGTNITELSEIDLKLFTYDCQATSTDTTVSIDSESFVAPNFLYEIAFDTDAIGNVNADYVTCLGSDKSDCGVGEITFCTRVTTLEGSIEVFFLDTNFNFEFNLTDNNFTLTEIEIDPQEPDTFVTDIESPFEVRACQCEDFNCTAKETIEQDDSLILCIEPFDPNGSDSVRITNFNLQVTAGDMGDADYVEYNPVWFSTDGYKSDALTLVKEDTASDTLMIVTPIIAPFFTRGHSSVNISGNAFLEFKVAKGANPVFSRYSMELELEIPGEMGCFKYLLNRFTSGR